MQATLRRYIRQKAGNRCEYCRISQAIEPLLRFHIEHIQPVQHHGSDDPENLALACPHCNFHKGTNIASIDPATGKASPLFNPRQQQWEVHFRCDGPLVIGLTAIGRTTAALLAFNAGDRIELRQEVAAESD